ncbi:DUF6166 domain-containing protein [Prosthecobacter sp.]|uniref:DUF6166 domain-containing protein n=1 Tax=Prosthecobacter sp. TaxID=1965333 RepID=UPI002489A282|nr:DUF6166 domain-containing protein [Prosthecobacter sp.]MDI1314023.1 hypothetical protein [Prosthecobacter sp.]
MAKIYHFIRQNGEVSIGTLSGQLKLYRPHQLVSHSAIEWGTESDGARILGFSILNDSLGEERSRHNCEKFMRNVLLPLALDEWRITEIQLSEFCDYHMNLEGTTFQSVMEHMNSSNQRKPTTYQDMPLRPLWLANPNMSLAVPHEESLAKK